MVSGSETIRHAFDGSTPASRSPHDGQPAGDGWSSDLPRAESPFSEKSPFSERSFFIRVMDISVGQSARRSRHRARHADHGKSCFGGGAHCIEQAARAIAGRLIPQLPARRRFHRTLLISAGPSPLGGRAAVPYRAVRMVGCGVGKIRTTTIR